MPTRAKKSKTRSASAKHKPAKRRPTVKQRLRTIAETPPDQGETGTNYPGEVLIAPEGIPLKVSVPGAPSPMEPQQEQPGAPRQAERPSGGTRGARKKKRAA